MGDAMYDLVVFPLENVTPFASASNRGAFRFVVDRRGEDSATAEDLGPLRLAHLSGQPHFQRNVVINSAKYRELRRAGPAAVFREFVAINLPKVPDVAGASSKARCLLAAQSFCAP